LPWQPPPDYPERLLCNGRDPDQGFSPTEKLYFRIPPLNADAEPYTELEGDAIQSIPFSVNREKYSNPEDVIALHSIEWGIGFFRVQDIPPQLVTETGIRFDFRVVHVPLNDESGNNYAHSEVRAFRDGDEVSNRDIGSTIKAALRLVLCARGKLFKRPQKIPQI
jgi:hypothetical protein